MAEYEMPVEEQLKTLVREFTSFSKEFASFRADVEQRFDKVDARFDKVDARLDKIDGRLDKMDVRLDQVSDVAKLGLEAVEGLRESMDKKFAAADKKHDQQIDLLKAVLVDVRKRVEIVERPKARRR